VISYIGSLKAIYVPQNKVPSKKSKFLFPLYFDSFKTVYSLQTLMIYLISLLDISMGIPFKQIHLWYEQLVRMEYLKQDSSQSNLFNLLLLMKVFQLVLAKRQ